MALFRCAACGSPNVVTDQEDNGIQFDYVKGAIGTVVLGAGGAVAGISNKSRFVFKCRDCGLSLSYPLGEPTKTLIDTGVASMAGRQTLNINGFPISWNTIKSKYPNIESGPADLEIEALAAHRSRNKKATVEYLMSLWRVDSADDEALLKKSEAELTAAQAEWEENKKTLETKKSEYLQTAMAERESRIHQLTVSKTNELNGIQARIREAEKEIDQLRQQLSTFGIFKFSEKASLKKQIADKLSSAAEMKSRLSQKSAEYDSQIEKEQQEAQTFRNTMTKRSDVIYAPAESPKDRFARLKKEQSELRMGRFSFQSSDVYIHKYYPHALSCYGKASEKELEDIFDAFLCEMTQLPVVFISFTSIPRATRYYEPFLTETVEGQVSTDIGTITKQGTIYYEYNGI